MDIQSRLLTVDFYDSKGDRCGSVQTLQESVSEALRTLNLTPLQIISSKQNSGHISLLALLPDGHIAVHVHPDLRHASLDIYLCQENVSLDPVTHAMRRIFQPDKMKSTHLRRGDFRSSSEIRPKTTTRVAPIRKIKSTGAKVIRILARRNRR